MFSFFNLIKKNRNKILFITILIVFFILGFLTNIVLNKNKEPIKSIKETDELISAYSISPNVIDSLEILSIQYYDTANIEMLHYVLEYNNKNKLPDFYVTSFGDTIEYNKENFFKYFTLYIVADNLLESRKQIINGLLINCTLKEKEEIKNKTKEKPTPK
jgi:hypothetical protein